MAKKEEVRPYPNNLLFDIFRGHEEVVGELSEDFTKKLEKIVRDVSSNEKFQCVLFRYRNNMTLKQVGEVCNGITAGRVRNLIDTTMRRLVHPRISRSIRELLREEFNKNPELKIIKIPETESPVAEKADDTKSDEFHFEMVEMRKFRMHLDRLPLEERCHALEDFMRVLEEKYHV